MKTERGRSRAAVAWKAAKWLSFPLVIALIFFMLRSVGLMANASAQRTIRSRDAQHTATGAP